MVPSEQGSPSRRSRAGEADKAAFSDELESMGSLDRFAGPSGFNPFAAPFSLASGSNARGAGRTHGLGAVQGL